MKRLKMIRDNSITFEQGCELYLNNCRERNLRQDTIRHYRQSYDQFYKFFDRDITVFIICKDIFIIFLICIVSMFFIY